MCLHTYNAKTDIKIKYSKFDNIRSRKHKIQFNLNTLYFNWQREKGRKQTQ